jgi:hypothetical protein
MPKGPRGEKRPAYAIGLAVMIGKIATGEIEDTQTDPLPKRGRYTNYELNSITSPF